MQGIYSSTAYTPPQLVIELLEGATLIGSFCLIEKDEKGLSAIAKFHPKPNAFHYFGIKPQKLIIINSGTKAEIQGDICFRSFEYLSDEHMYKVVLGVKNEKFIRT